MHTEIRTFSPWESALFLVVTLVALAEVKKDEHIQHHPNQRRSQHHFTVRKLPHLHTCEAEK